MEWVLVDYWDVARTERYYGKLFRRFDRINRALEIAIAVGTTGSGVSAWAVWKYGVGPSVWAVITGAASLTAIVKPILNLSKRQEEYHKVWIEYNAAKRELAYLLSDIAYGSRPADIRGAILKIRGPLKQVWAYDEPWMSEKERKALRRDMLKQVADELPSNLRDRLDRLLSEQKPDVQSS